jgi:hypothetical protein
MTLSVIYRKFGDKKEFVYCVVGAHGYANTAYEKIYVNFTEVTEDETGIYERPLEETYSATLTMIFDFFFDEAEDALGTIGLFAAVTLIAIFWAYNVFCFEIY